MMASNWPLSKDEIYGPPPAYSFANHYENPPSYTPSIYVLPAHEMDFPERPPVDESAALLPSRYTRYLLGSGLVHMVLGLAAIVSDVILTIMNESYSFTGLWTGALYIMLGIYLILFMSHPRQRRSAFQRLKLFHVALVVVSIVAMVLAAINLASDSCYKVFLGPDRCHDSAYLLKILLVIFFSLTFVQLCITIAMTCTHTKQSCLTVTRATCSTPVVIR